ncbi:bifunctional molybdenum cofactor biosynthesis [Chaetomidium leptoderma]|uniref:Bifunctional molybdenum cofactor biosynthesis n=1 Tax=Chaetomidium leptoderma TaxID=669021 RepID=A0AAN6VBQ2_9PEZI|nr:bifunctional molybdenum cofactor biosynthesis [Chaetomidium leptoderma]
MTLTPLIFAGGKSTRMQSPKHLLQLPDGRPLYQHQIDLLARTLPTTPVIYISLAQDSELDDYLQSLASTTTSKNPTSHATTNLEAKPKVKVIHDLTPNQSPESESAGPAAGLLAAHNAQPDTTWLVIACDYPLLTTTALQQLCRAYHPPVTCFRNRDGYCEPLVGIWSPEALGRLAERVDAAARGGGGCSSGRRGVGPSRVVKENGRG